jgi:7-carboxy-7-deazaguanine synthase
MKTGEAHYQVNELFTSPQGEGFWTGRLSTFIRLQGCTVGCPWCDSGPLADLQKGRQTNGMTRNTWGKGGVRMTLSEIVGQVNTYHVVITGGEPTLYNLDPLLERLIHNYTQIETSGQNNLKGSYEPDWLTWSPKQTLAWEAPDDLKWIVSEVKWVVDEPLQWEKVIEVWNWYQENRGNNMPWFYFMP